MTNFFKEFAKGLGIVNSSKASTEIKPGTPLSPDLGHEVSRKFENGMLTLVTIKEIPASADLKLAVNNTSGDVQVVGSDVNDKLVLQSTYHIPCKSAEEGLQRINDGKCKAEVAGDKSQLTISAAVEAIKSQDGGLSITNKGGRVVIRGDISGASYVSVSTGEGGEDSVVVIRGGGSIDFSILTPKSSSTDVKTALGKVSLSNVKGQASIQTSLGNIDGANLGPISVVTSQGKTELGKIAGDARIKSGSGDITLSDVSNNLIINTSQGTVRISGVAGQAKIESSSGDITGENLGSAQINTSQGTILLNQVTGDVQVRSSSGDIRGTNLGPTTFKTSQGNTTLNEVNGNIIGESSSGDIEVTKPNSLNIDLRSSQGNIKYKGPSDIKLITSTRMGDVSRQKGFESNPNSNKTVALRTTSGDIQVRA